MIDPNKKFKRVFGLEVWEWGNRNGNENNR